MMKKNLLMGRLGKSFAMILFTAATLLSAQAQVKIATVDLREIFDNYWRTKQADANLKERAADFDNSRKDMVADYEKANAEYRKLMEASNDQAISESERDKRKKSAEAKLLEIKEIENSINQFDRTSRQTLGEQQKRMRDNILRDIREIIDTKAKAAKYTLVLDTAAVTPNQTPIILFATKDEDLTEAVLTQLNVSAPPNFQNK